MLLFCHGVGWRYFQYLHIVQTCSGTLGKIVCKDKQISFSLIVPQKLWLDGVKILHGREKKDTWSERSFILWKTHPKKTFRLKWWMDGMWRSWYAVEIKEQKFIMFVNENILVPANADFVYSLLQIKKVYMRCCDLISIKAMCRVTSVCSRNDCTVSEKRI